MDNRFHAKKMLIKSNSFFRLFTVYMLTAMVWLSLCAGSAYAQKENGGKQAPDKLDPRSVFSWSPEQLFLGFKSVEKIAKVHTVDIGPEPRLLPTPILPATKKLAGELDKLTDDFMKNGPIAGVLILNKDLLLVEKYSRGFTADDRWTSFSVAKSVTSTLVGAAVTGGYIKNIDDLVTAYVPELQGTAYDGVTIRHLLTMTSGVAWNEDYSDPNSDVASIALGLTDPGHDIIATMSGLSRESKPGSKFAYKTGESNLLGLIIIRATKKSLSQYLSEIVWKPYGMERTAYWAVDGKNQELAGCCLSASLRDYGRFGQFMLSGGLIGNRETLPLGWVHEATLPVKKDISYGYQWHLVGDGSYFASGIFGQLVYIDPDSQTVVVILSAWDQPLSNKHNNARHAFVTKVITKIGRPGAK